MTTKADLLVLAGFGSFGAGLWFIYRPLAALFVGLVCLLLARVAQKGK